MSDVAIIGAGLSGLSLSLALHKKGIKAVTYEMRPEPLDIGGAVMLSPNALRILDYLGVYERIRVLGFSFETNDYIDVSSNKLIEQQEFGNEVKYGYKALRVYRHILIKTLLEMLREEGLEVKYGNRFKRILNESSAGTRWEWEDGSFGEAKLLIGADGIRSTVRKYLYPDVEPEFMFGAGITSIASISRLGISTAEITGPITFMLPNAEAVIIAPQQPDASEIFIGKQRRLKYEPTRTDWKDLLEENIDFLKMNKPEFPELVHRVAANISQEKVNVWPFYRIPKLKSWASPMRRVIILGDAAHAIPPSAGQGINQAFEDIYMFASLLATAGNLNAEDMNGEYNDARMKDALDFWHDYRTHRVDKVLELNAQIELRRVPAGPDASDAKKEPLELGWLYKEDFNEVINEYLSKKSS